MMIRTLDASNKLIEYKPNDYLTTDYPVVFFIHGVGENGDGSEGELPLVETNGLPENAKNGREYPFILICGQYETGTNVTTTYFAPLYAYAKTTHPKSPAKHVTGLSQGGYHVYRILEAYKNTFTTATVLCGVPLADLAPVDNTKVIHWHGTLDTTVNYTTASNNFTTYVTDGGYTEAEFVPMVGYAHNIWDDVYALDGEWDVYMAEYFTGTYTSSILFTDTELAVWRDRVVEGVS